MRFAFEARVALANMVSGHHLFAMWLISPAFFWTLAAISLPLWLHLTRRLKYQEMPVGTLRFLREALRERRKRARFEEIPLMLLRILAVILLALIFTRPVWPRVERSEAADAETIILLDASGSVTREMAKAARAAAEQAIGAAGAKTVTLAQFSDRVEVIQTLDQFQPRAGAPTNLQAALEWSLDRFQSEHRSSGKVVLVAHLAVEALPKKPPRVWFPQYEVELAPLEPPTIDNAAVRQVALLSPFVAKEMEVEARVQFPAGAKDRSVKFEAGDVKQTVVAPPGAERVTFRFAAPSAVVRGWVSVTGHDPWPADDRRPFALRWTEPRRILLVDGRPGSTPFEGQAYFLQKALDASGAAHGKSPFLPEIVFGLEGKQGLADLKGVGAVALCGMTEISPGVARLLADYVRSGGGLVCVLDESWNPATTAALTEAGLFPEGIALTKAEEVRSIASWEHSYPALAPFDGRDGGDLRDLKWRDGFDIQRPAGWRALASLDGGHPLFVEKVNATKTEGDVVICAHPLTRAWTDLPLAPLFVPLMKNLFATVSRLPPPAAVAEPKSPGVHETRPPGLYPETGGGVEVIVADSAENQVVPAEVSVFRAAFGLPKAGAAKEAAAARKAQVMAGPRDLERQGELWPWLAIALCAVLAIENLVATRRRKILSTAL